MADLHTLSAGDIFTTVCQSRHGVTLKVENDPVNRRISFEIERRSGSKLVGFIEPRNASGFPVTFSSVSPPIVCRYAEELYDVLYGLLTPVGIALEESKPISGTDPPQYEPIMVQTFPAVGAAYFVPTAPPKPSPDLTICGQSISLIPAGSIVVVHNETNDPVLTAKVCSVAIDLSKERPDLRFVVIPGGTTLEAAELHQLAALRDRLNEIVYDKEHGR